MYHLSQVGGGACSLCGSPGTNKSTCPLNKAAKNPNYSKHNVPAARAPNQAQSKTKQVKTKHVATKIPEVTQEHILLEKVRAAQTLEELDTLRDTLIQLGYPMQLGRFELPDDADTTTAMQLYGNEPDIMNLRMRASRNLLNHMLSGEIFQDDYLLEDTLLKKLRLEQRLERQQVQKQERQKAQRQEQQQVQKQERQKAQQQERQTRESALFAQIDAATTLTELDTLRDILYQLGYFLQTNPYEMPEDESITEALALYGDDPYIMNLRVEVSKNLLSHMITGDIYYNNFNLEDALIQKFQQSKAQPKPKLKGLKSLLKDDVDINLIGVTFTDIKSNSTSLFLQKAFNKKVPLLILPQNLTYNYALVQYNDVPKVNIKVTDSQNTILVFTGHCDATGSFYDDQGDEYKPVDVCKTLGEALGVWPKKILFYNCKSGGYPQDQIDRSDSLCHKFLTNLANPSITAYCFSDKVTRYGSAKDNPGHAFFVKEYPMVSFNYNTSTKNVEYQTHGYKNITDTLEFVLLDKHAL